MKIISLTESAQLGTTFLHPFTRYVVPDDVAVALSEASERVGRVYTVSSFNSYEKRYSGQETGILALFRHQAWGDQLMMTAVVNCLHHIRPDVRTDVYCSKEVKSIWHGVSRAYPAPMHFDAIKNYTHHAFYEGMLENNSEPDQGNAVDDMLQFIGIDPTEVPDRLKRPVVVSLGEDMDELEELRLDLSSPYVLVQLQAGNPNRSYPPKQLADVCVKLVDAGLRVVIVGKSDGKRIEGIDALGVFSFQVRNLVNMLDNFRSLIPLVSNAKCVICPDSSIGHLAGAFPDVPVVSLWGLFNPAERIRYYPNHHPIFKPELCHHSPCHDHHFELPQMWCKDSILATEGKQEYCNVLKGITADEIVQKVMEIKNDT